MNRNLRRRAACATRLSLLAAAPIRRPQHCVFTCFGLVTRRYAQTTKMRGRLSSKAITMHSRKIRAWVHIRSQKIWQVCNVPIFSYMINLPKKYSAVRVDSRPRLNVLLRVLIPKLEARPQGSPASIACNTQLCHSLPQHVALPRNNDTANI